MLEYFTRMATLVECTAECMKDVTPDDDTEYLATKRLLLSSQWKFAHHSDSCSVDNVPEVIVHDQLEPLTVHLPGIYYVQAGVLASLAPAAPDCHVVYNCP